jgi:ELWxxDGT repeat protein
VGGTRRVTELDSDFPGPRELTAFQGRLYFAAETEALGRELWVSDGTAAGTKSVKDISPDDRSADPRFLTVHAGRLWFSADDGDQGRQLWSTDGTAAGTRRELEGIAGLDGFISAMISAGSRLFISSSSGLWITDGTAPGTRRLSHVEIAFDVKPVVIGGSLIFQGHFFVDSLGRSGLWKSDGTEAGTVLIDEEVYAHRALYAVGGQVLFRQEIGWLMEWDGTAVRKILEDVGEIAPAGGLLFFNHFAPATGSELWVLD